MRYLILLLSLAGMPAAAITLETDFGFEDYDASDLTPGTVIDATGARWNLQNSTLEQPTVTYDMQSEPGGCDDPSGTQPINRYPVDIEDSPGVAFFGGLIIGDISQTADWNVVYCNSAAVTVRGGSKPSIRDVRIIRPWDGVRVSENETGVSDNFLIERIWISEGRDDCMENDKMLSGDVRDMLCESFAGISMADNELTESAKTEATFDGILIRTLPYLYEGRTTSAGAFKHSEFHMKKRVYNSVLAMEAAHSCDPASEDCYAGTPSRQWDNITDCRNNLFIWISDEPIPEEVGTPPDCFRVVTGAKDGAALWERIKRNWIDCHPDIRRASGDPISRPAECDRTFYGWRS